MYKYLNKSVFSIVFKTIYFTKYTVYMNICTTQKVKVTMTCVKERERERERQSCYRLSTHKINSSDTITNWCVWQSQPAMDCVIFSCQFLRCTPLTLYKLLPMNRVLGVVFFLIIQFFTKSKSEIELLVAVHNSTSRLLCAVFNLREEFLLFISTQIIFICSLRNPFRMF